MVTSLLSQQVTARHNSRTLEIHKVLSYPDSHWSFPPALPNGQEEVTGFQKGVLSELSGRTGTRLQPQSAHLWPFVLLPFPSIKLKKDPQLTPRKDSLEGEPVGRSLCFQQPPSVPHLIEAPSKAPLEGRDKASLASCWLLCLSTLQTGGGTPTPGQSRRCPHLKDHEEQIAPGSKWERVGA